MSLVTRSGSWILRVATILTITTLCACATPPKDPEARAQFEQMNDPLEPMNRQIFTVNLYFDRYFLRPVAIGYRYVFPQFTRDALRHFLDNLSEPVVFANDVLQGSATKASRTLARFALNSTVGLGGLRDVATGIGYKRQSGDFGQTLHSWGLPEGPYLVLPILGPSNPRDAVGYGIDSYLDPLHYVAQNNDLDELMWGRFIVDGVDRRSRVIEELDDLQKNSLDYYAQLRSIVRQHRAAELGEPLPTMAPSGSGSLYDDPQAFAPGAGAAVPAAKPIVFDTKATTSSLR